MTARAKIGTPREGVNGLAGIACVGDPGLPQLCATDMDQIPGQPDIHASVVAAAPAPSGRIGPWLAVAGGVAGVAALTVGGVFLLRRRRRPAHTQDHDDHELIVAEPPRS
jgi:hypothetical protein